MVRDAQGPATGPAAEIASLIGIQAVRCDLPMGDARDGSRQVRATAQEPLAEAVGARQVPLSANGASLSVHVLMSAIDFPRARFAREGSEPLDGARLLRKRLAADVPEPRGVARPARAFPARRR